MAKIDKIKLTKSEHSYIELTENRVKEKLKGYKKEYSSEFLKNMTNVLSWPESLRDTYAFPEIDTSVESKEVEKAVQMQNRLKEIEYQYLPDGTPFENAVNVMEYLISQQKKEEEENESGDEGNEGESEDGNGEGGGDMSMEDFFHGNKRGTVDQMNYDLQLMKNVKPGSYQEHLFNPQKKDRWEIMRELDHTTRDLMSKISMIKSLNTIKAIKSTKLVESKRGKVKQKRRIKKTSEIKKLTKKDLVQDKLIEKLVRKKLKPVIRYDLEQECQYVFLLIDISGSMDNYYKKNWLAAVIANRLDEIKSKGAKVVLVPFESEIFTDNIILIENDKDAIKVLNNLWGYLQLDHGGTDVCHCIKELEEMIKSGSMVSMFHEKPFEVPPGEHQITIVNDGEDTIDLNYTCDIVLNAITLGQRCDDLEYLCKKSKGQYFAFYN